MNELSPAQGHAIRKVIMNHQGTGRETALVFYLINTPVPVKSSGLRHVLALELLQVSM